MAKKFPKNLYVKIEKDSGAEYFVADDSIVGMVEMGARIKIATYQLVAVQDAEGVVDLGKAVAAKKRR